jgi:hypothetical protein
MTSITDGLQDADWRDLLAKEKIYKRECIASRCKVLDLLVE